MPTLSILQRSLIAIVLFILALVFSIPWGLYYLGLKDIDGKPDLPAHMISGDMQQKSGPSPAMRAA
jgi:predicted RND superfamily exporter protein